VSTSHVDDPLPMRYHAGGSDGSDITEFGEDGLVAVPREQYIATSERLRRHHRRRARTGNCELALVSQRVRAKSPMTPRSRRASPRSVVHSPEVAGSRESPLVGGGERTRTADFYVANGLDAIVWTGPI
jgi:hypothetical protein